MWMENGFQKERSRNKKGGKRDRNDALDSKKYLI